MPSLSSSQATFLWVVGILGMLFFVAVCYAIYWIFKRIERGDAEQTRKYSQPPADSEKSDESAEKSSP